MPKMTSGKKTGSEGGRRKKPAPYDPSAGREVKYPEVKVKQTWGDKPLTAQMARELLGWQEEADDVEFSNNFLVKDLNGKKVRALNNVGNRPFYTGVMDRLKQEILMKRWSGPNGAGGTINGESIIIGKTGLVLNGQHTLVALVLAAQEYAGPQKAHWEQYWDREPVIDKSVFVGIDESPQTTNTMDTCKPRSLMEVLYRSPYFAKLKEHDRKMASKMAAQAVAMLWSRSGWGDERVNAFAPRRTHAEYIDFLDRHPKILECVDHIRQENQERSIGALLNPGHAAGLLYLMGSSGTSAEQIDVYRSMDQPREGDTLDWSLWDKACDFWVILSAKTTPLLAVRSAIAAMTEGGTPTERLAILAKAWATIQERDVVEQSDVQLDYQADAEGILQLVDSPTFGGIDLGDPSKSDFIDTVVDKPPTEEEIEATSARQSEERAAKVEKLINQRKWRSKAKSANAPPPDGRSILDYEPPAKVEVSEMTQ